MSIRMTGMNSGLDTESIIRDLMVAHSVKKGKMEKSQIELQWKQESWKTMNAKIYGFYNSTLSNLKYSSDYSRKATNVNDTSLATIEAGDNAVLGSQTLAVKQLAKSAYLTGGKIDGSVTGDTKLSDLPGATDTPGSFTIKADGKERTVEIDANTTIDDVVLEFREAGLDASFDETNNRFFISSKQSGADNNFEITANNAGGSEALKNMKIHSNSAVLENGEYIKWDGYYVAGDDAATLANMTEEIAVELEKRKEGLTKANEKLEEDKIDLAVTKLEAEKGLEMYTETDPVTKAVYDAAIAASDAAAATPPATTATLGERVAYLGGLVQEQQDLNEGEREELERLEAAEAEAIAGGAEPSAELQTLRGNKAARDEIINENNGHMASLNVAKGYEDTALNAQTKFNEKTDLIAKNVLLIDGDPVDGKTLTNAIEEDFLVKAKTASDALDAAGTGEETSGVVHIQGIDGIILLNGAEFSSSTSDFNVNGLIITANKVSEFVEGTTDELVTTNINTTNDIEAMYDVVRDFIKEYSILMNEMDKMINAEDSGYEPLTEEEKESLSEKEVENWEEKIKSSSLRKDETLDSVMSSMQEIMRSGIEIDGEAVFLSDYGINTQDFFGAAETERNAYHIDGDAENPLSAGNDDMLRAGIAEDPDKMAEFFAGLVQKLSAKLFDQMGGDYSMSSSWTVYNDKKMAEDYKQYTEDIAEEEARLLRLEDKYYAEFGAMEVAMGKINASSSALAGMM